MWLRGLKVEMPVSDLDGQTLDKVCVLHTYISLPDAIEQFSLANLQITSLFFFHSTLLADSVNIFPLFLIA